MTRKYIINLGCFNRKKTPKMEPKKRILRKRKASVYLTVWTLRALVKAGLPHHLRKTHRHKELCSKYEYILLFQKKKWRCYHPPWQQNSSSVSVLLEELEQIRRQCQIAAQRLQLSLRGNCTRSRRLGLNYMVTWPDGDVFAQRFSVTHQRRWWAPLEVALL